MRCLTTLVAITALLALPTCAGAQETFVWFYGAGTGDFMNSPVVFGGTMDPGGDIVAGSWTITVPDADWPTEPVARAAHIWDTYYSGNYTPGNPSVWTGYFDVAHGGSALNDLYIIDDTNGGTMIGVCSIEIQVVDMNNNGVLDGDEFCNGSLSGLIVIIRDGGTGVYDGLCGTGNYFGTYSKVCPATTETWNYGMYLWLEGCG